MVQKGMIVKDDRLYSLQPLFYNEDVLRETFKKLEGLVQFMAKFMIADDNLDAWEVIKHNMICFMSCVDIDRKEEKK